MENQILDSKDQVLSIIYIVTCEKTKKQYVGQTLTHYLNHKRYRPYGAIGRWKAHVNEALCNTKTKQCSYLNNAIRKYGSPEFMVSVLKKCKKEDADHYERKYIKKYNTLFPEGYNLTEGGKTVISVSYQKYQKLNPISDGSWRNQKKSKETKSKISKSGKIFWNSEEGKSITSSNAKEQHLKRKLKQIGNIHLKQPIEYYIKPVISKITKEPNSYKVIINDRVYRFISKHETPEQIYERAKDFVQKIKNMDS